MPTCGTTVTWNVPGYGSHATDADSMDLPTSLCGFRWSTGEGRRRIGYTQLLNRHLRTRGTARDFEQALDAIAAELLAGPVIDYQHRREALASWTLEPENWQRMLDQLPVLTSHRKPISDDRRHLAVSAYIWTRVTEGEPDFAPCPPHIAPDPALRAVCDTTCSTGSAKLTTSPTTERSHCSKTTPGTWPRRSTTAPSGG
ncbi:hypothetical protein ACFC0C_24770 [Streptomyces sp. NPDC056178]|uniref:hypothetical protein n=1 Tax=unclassified Streptomyces TaxID=2593676 RepID=UPI0035D8D8ED